MKLRPLALAAAAAFAGCAQYVEKVPSVGPDYSRPVYENPAYVLPDAGSPTTNLTAAGEYVPASEEADPRLAVSTNELARWWTLFNDDVLEGLVRDSVSNNVTFRMAVARLDRANWELLGSYAAFLPKFAGAADWHRYWLSPGNTTYGDNGAYADYNAAQIGLEGRWEIDLFGGNRRATEAALAAAEAAGWSVADAWVQLTTEIGLRYIQLRTCQERIAVARTNLALQSETYQILKSRLDSGIGDELAVNQCAYIVERTRAQIPTLLSGEESLKNALAILAGAKPGALHGKLAAVTDGRDWLLAPQRIADLPLDLMRSRPDVMQAERELAAQCARIGMAKAQWFPKLYVTGTVGWETKNGARLFSRESFFASIGPAISWPIFQGGAIYANVKAQEARTEDLALAYSLAIDKAYSEVRDEYAAYTQEYHRYQSLRAAVKAATDAVAISQDLYKNGLKDFNNVLDAQRSRLELEEQLTISRGQITQNLIRLYKALGGGLAQTR